LQDVPENARVPVFLTGYAFQMPPDKADRHEVWMKPMRPRELIAEVERCIGKSWQRIG
jgi:hypothetical protein